MVAVPQRRARPRQRDRWAGATVPVVNDQRLGRRPVPRSTSSSS
ncbi:hypothetical protein ACU4GD_06920 [Cupriavidus basilensis]